MPRRSDNVKCRPSGDAVHDRAADGAQEQARQRLAKTDHAE